MNPGTWIALGFLWYMIFLAGRKRKKVATLKPLKNRKDGREMEEMARKFIGRECLIYGYDNANVTSGIIREVENGAMLIEKDGAPEVINLSFVIRIREYPRNKKGKKKSIVV